MARDMPTTVRTEEDLYKFMVHLAKKERRGVSTLMAIVIEDFAIEHGYHDWLEEQHGSRLAGIDAVLKPRTVSK